MPVITDDNNRPVFLRKFFYLVMNLFYQRTGSIDDVQVFLLSFTPYFGLCSVGTEKDRFFAGNCGHSIYYPGSRLSQIVNNMFVMDDMS